MPPAAAHPPVVAAGPRKGPVTLQGRLLDGSAMARSSMSGAPMGHDILAGLARVPLASRGFRIQVVDGPAKGRSFTATSDGDGKFAVVLDVPSLPAGPCLVAAIDVPKALFSPALPFRDGEVEFRVYPTTDDEKGLESEVDIQHSLAKDAGGKAVLNVSVQVFASNAGDALFVGRPREEGGRSPAREVLRIPVPPDAQVVEDPTVQSGRWTEVAAGGGWRWFVIDSPIPPRIEESHGISRWQLQYRAPARQDFTVVYPAGFNLGMFAAWWTGEDITLESPLLPLKDRQPDPGNPNSEERPWRRIIATDVEGGSRIPVTIRIDNAILGQVSHGSLFLLAALLLAAACAILAGLIVGRRSAALDPDLEEVTGEEVIGRIASLDEDHAKGLVGEKAWRERREKLLAKARYLVGETERAAPARALHAPAPEGAPALPTEAQDIVARLKVLGGEGRLDPARIHERAVLLEELARVLGASPEARGGKEASRR
jgi:hypothetical protein